MTTDQRRRSSRRVFLGQSLAATALVGAGLGTSQAVSANEKLNIAIIGTQNRASGNIAGVQHENIVALCDVDADYLGKRSEQFPKASAYRDYRKMLEREEKNIDAVVISTADHTHAPATVMALRMGKHVYCEKPLTHTVEEARLVAKLAKEKGVATQMGTQIHAGDNYRRVVELIQSGAIGDVHEAYVWCNKAWSDGRFDFGKPVPKNLDWDLWLGPAKEIPYSANVHPANWRRFWAFGTGTLGDMGCHVIDLAQWALKLQYATEVWAEGPPVHEVGTPTWMASHLKFPARDGLAPVTLHWYDGGEHPQIVKETLDQNGKPLSNRGLGILFVGSKGMCFADYGSRLLLPQDKFEGFQAPEPTIPSSVGHHQEWINACKTGSPTLCNFDYASALTETVLLGTVAYRAGERLQWDAENLRAVNCSKADEFIRKEYRKGFELS